MPDQPPSRPPGERRGVSLELKTTLVVATACLGLLLALLFLVDPASPVQVAAAVLAVFAVVALTFDVWVYRPIHALIRRARARLGGAYERSDPYYRDELRELGFLVGTMIAVFTAAEDKEWVSQAIKEDLMRLQALNRQLLDVSALARELGGALPYRETVTRVLTRGRAFLHADFAALLRFDPETRAFALEGSDGVRAPTLSADCCAYTADCPVRQAVSDGRLHRVEGHRCDLFPHTMTHQLVLPLVVEGVGDMALLATATSDAYFSLLTDDILATVRDHAQTALANAHRYDAVRRQVVTDHLTGLYNRRYFAQRAAEEVERSLRHQVPLSVLMVDIDHFKRFNDRHGHATGDRVLQTVAHALRDALRTSDVCARYGGEEFAVLLPATPGENAYFVAERVRRTLRETRYTGLGLPPDASITISIGVATCPRDATTLDGLMELADQALYRAKAAGRDAVAVWSGAAGREAGD